MKKDLKLFLIAEKFERHRLYVKLTENIWKHMEKFYGNFRRGILLGKFECIHECITA